jgi:hypothetical protein
MPRRRHGRTGLGTGLGAGLMGPVSDAVLVLGARIVAALSPDPGPDHGGAPTAPPEILARLVRAAALGAVLRLSRRVAGGGRRSGT